MTDGRAPSLPPAAFALALASLPGAGPASLRAALDGRTPFEAWTAVRNGNITRPSTRAVSSALADNQLALVAPPVAVRARSLPSWRDAAARADLHQQWEETLARHIGVTWLGDDRYPARLVPDSEAPPILFWRGDLDCVAKPTVAVVGTRHCTPAGRAVAVELGRELADAGVCVVSGMALGIDGAAHRGALESTRLGGVTAGIAASGVDVAYPRQHAELWERVVAMGVVVAETAPGRPAQAWRFPARNRIIAALADMVVVVESFEAGGSLLTVDAALARGVDVRAVPGPVHSPASSGTNRLLVDGAAPVRHAGDILDALGIARSGAASGSQGNSSDARRGIGGGPRKGEVSHRVSGSPVSGAPGLDPQERRVLEAVGWAPTPLGRIVERSGTNVGTVVSALSRLEEVGLIMAGGSWWVRRSER